MNGGDAGVGERGGQTRLAEEPGDDVGVEILTSQHLHRDAAPRPVLPTLVHPPESSRADRPQELDAVDGEIRWHLLLAATGHVGHEPEGLQQRPLGPCRATVVVGQEPLEAFEPCRVAAAGTGEKIRSAGSIGDGQRPLEEVGVAHQASPRRRASRRGPGASSSQRQASHDRA